MKAAWIAGGCAVVGAIISSVTGVLPAVLHSNADGPNSSVETVSPSAAPLPTTLTSASGLDVQSSTFYEPGVDTFFVTKNTFQPTGQIAATLVNAPSVAYLSVFHNAGAVNQAQTVLRLVFIGDSQQGVHILNITPIIIQRAAPWHGDVFQFPLQGVAPILKTNLDLDDNFPIVEDSTTGRPYFEDNTITLQQGEQQVVIMHVTAERGFVAYELRVDYLVGTQQQRTIINDHGQPFKISAVNCIRKNFESYGLRFEGIVANLNSAREPSQFQSTCLPNSPGIP